MPKGPCSSHSAKLIPRTKMVFALSAAKARRCHRPVPGLVSDAERSVFQPQIIVSTNHEDGVRINRIETPYVAIHQLPGWWNGAERSMLQPQRTVSAEDVYGVYINRVESCYVAIDLLPGWWDDAERSVLQPQRTVITKDEDGFCRNLRESRYVAIDLLSGWWNGAERSSLPPQIPARAEHENLLAAKGLEWPLEKEQPEQFLFYDVYLK